MKNAPLFGDNFVVVSKNKRIFREFNGIEFNLC